MNKLLLTLITLSAGAGVFHTVRHSATRLEQETQALRQDWLANSQALALAQTDLAAVTERVRDLQHSLRSSPPVADSPLWSALQTNRADRLPRQLRDQVRAELGFHWRFSPDYIVVSKKAVRDIRIQAISRGKLNDATVGVLSITPEERALVDNALGQVRTSLEEWVKANVQRGEPAGEVLAQYTLPATLEAGLSISNALMVSLSQALGSQRTDLVRDSIASWVASEGMFDGATKPTSFTVLRSAPEQGGKIKAVVHQPKWTGGPQTISPTIKDPFYAFPAMFRSMFPRGWTSVAEREGFELPEPGEKK